MDKQKLKEGKRQGEKGKGARLTTIPGEYSKIDTQEIVIKHKYKNQWLALYF